jgi:hypothetical protein
VLAVLAWAILILGLFAGKMVGVEMFAVFQISFLGLVTIPEINPTLAALKNLIITNGFNKYLAFDLYSA